MISVLALLALIGGEVYMQSAAPRGAPLTELPSGGEAVPIDPPTAEVPLPEAVEPPEPAVAEPLPEPSTGEAREDATTAGVTGSSRTTMIGVAATDAETGRGSGETSKE